MLSITTRKLFLQWNAKKNQKFAEFQRRGSDLYRSALPEWSSPGADDNVDGVQEELVAAERRVSYERVTQASDLIRGCNTTGDRKAALVVVIVAIEHHIDVVLLHQRVENLHEHEA